MSLSNLNHVTIRSADLEATRDFYRDALGLVEGPRPPLGFPGYWLYCGEFAVIHLVPPDNNGGGGGMSTDTGNFDHVAFTASDYDGMCRRLAGLGIKFREQKVAATSIRQLFFQDPNNVSIELNFA